MKYFTEEILEMLEMECETDYLEGLRLWRKHDDEYHDKFEKIKTRLPIDFLNAYLENEHFHDYEPVKIDLNYCQGNGLKPLEFKVHLKYSNKEATIKILNIKKLELDLSKTEVDLGYWRYSEILPVDDAILSFEILFSSGSKILIHFNDKDISADY